MHFRALATGLCSFCLLSPLHAEEPLPPCGSPVSMPNKPDLEDYPDYTDFLLQIMKYKKARHLREAHQANCPDDYLPAQVASSDPTVIVEPETLDEALERTNRIEPIDYQVHPTWYDRTTSRSFALPPMASPRLSSEHIRTLLGNAGNDEPLVLPMTIVGMQLDGVNDGGAAEHLAQDSTYQTLLYTEGSIMDILFSADGALSAIGNSGNLTFFYNKENESFLTSGLIEVESCLSSGCPDQ